MKTLRYFRYNTKSSGFTIVEILVVIVIIGILAGLVISAYTGIQVRARNTSRIASAQGLQKLINTYVSQENAYPANTSACAGAGYTDWDSDGTLDCNINNGTNTVHTLASFDTELQKVAKTIPKVETTTVQGNGPGYRGYIFSPNVTIDGQTGRAMLIYYLEGTNQNCGLTGVLTFSGSVFVSNGASNTLSSYNGTTLCYVSIVAT